MRMPNLSLSLSLSRSLNIYQPTRFSLNSMSPARLNIYQPIRFSLSNMSPARLSPMAPVTHYRQTPPTSNPTLTLKNSKKKLRSHQDRSSTTPMVIMMIPTSRLGLSTTPQEGTTQLAPCTLLVCLGSRILLVATQTSNSRASSSSSNRASSSNNNRASNRKGTRARRKVSPLLGPLNNLFMDTRKQRKA